MWRSPRSLINQHFPHATIHHNFPLGSEGEAEDCTTNLVYQTVTGFLYRTCTEAKKHNGLISN